VGGCVFGGRECEQRGVLRRALRRRRDVHAEIKSGVVRQAGVKIRASEIVRGLGRCGGSVIWHLERASVWVTE